MFEKLPITDKKLVTYQVCGSSAIPWASAHAAYIQDARDDLLHESEDVPTRAMDDIVTWIHAHLLRRRPSGRTR